MSTIVSRCPNLHYTHGHETNVHCEGGDKPESRYCSRQELNDSPLRNATTAKPSSTLGGGGARALCAVEPVPPSHVRNPRAVHSYRLARTKKLKAISPKPSNVSDVGSKFTLIPRTLMPFVPVAFSSPS